VVQALDLPKWQARHDPTKIASILDPFFLQFRKTVPATSKIFVLGHCFGGKYAFQLAATENVTSSVIMHPVC
jgi:dienelactone hydrolase